MSVLGGGTMSPGIAAAFAAHGYRVVIWTRKPDQAEAAAERAREMISFLAANELASDAPTASERLEWTSTLDDVATADLVVEAISEELEAKSGLMRRVEKVCSDHTLLATNTSGLRVTDIARSVRRPDRVVAMHFWNPAHLMPLVEIAGGKLGSAASVDRAVEVTHAIGKLPVVLEHEVLGFLGTRMQQAVVREAIALFQASIASAEAIDLAARTSFGIRFPILGPLETTDLAGLDVIGSIHEYLLADLDASVEPQPALQERLARGDLGAKSGRGFHDWSARSSQELLRERDEELVRRLRLLGQQGVLEGGEGRRARGSERAGS